MFGNLSALSTSASYHFIHSSRVQFGRRELKTLLRWDPLSLETVDTLH